MDIKRNTYHFIIIITTSPGLGMTTLTSGASISSFIRGTLLSFIVTETEEKKVVGHKGHGIDP